MKYWRSLGHRIVMFLDDGIGGSTCYELASETSRFVKESLVDFGFLLADNKCNWEPVKEVVWLGHVLNMIVVQTRPQKSSPSELFMVVLCQQVVLYSKLFVSNSCFRNFMMPASEWRTYRVIALESYIP